MIPVLTLLTVTAIGIAYFVFGQGLWVISGLAFLTLLTRFNKKTRAFGKFVELLFIFCFISFLINQFGIYYPYSLIIVLTFAVILIFFEGPEWSQLYFLKGNSKNYLKLSLGFATFVVFLYLLWIYFKRSSIPNPVPLHWPIDTLIILGIGFAIYLSMTEEIIFRSFIFERAKTVAGANWAIPIQGTFYGLMHYRSGVPNGLEGVLLGGLFGMGLGYLVKKTSSIYLSIFVHFIVTLLVFVELSILSMS
ncbi:MAG: type II CAAX prenyl endopeptidase Rce1 family protein [bacterium]